MEVYFHLNSRETHFPYKFFNSRPPWQCCCLLLGFQHFFWFFMQTFSFRPYCRKPVQDRAEIHFCARLVSTERKNQEDKSVMWVRVGQASLAFQPWWKRDVTALQLRCAHTSSLLNQSTEHEHAPSQKNSSRCILKYPPCLQQQVRWADTHPLGTTSQF